MIYHILPEAEAFSDTTGGAVSRWVANVIHADADAVVVCPRADSSWNLPESRIVRMHELEAYHQLLRMSRWRLPWRLRVLAVRAAFARFSATLCTNDTVYIHNRPEFVPAFRSDAYPGPRVILHLHNSHLATYPASIVELAIADLTVFCSRFLEQEALERLPGLAPTIVIGNGADPLRFYPKSNMRGPSESAIPMILFVGRLVPEKGAHVLIDALKILETRNVPASAKIIGSANFSSRTETEYVKRLHQHATANLTFIPHLSGEALAAEYRGATLFCCPSVWNESFGMVNVEAMASEIAVVASAVGGITEVFANGGAILVPPDDSVALADALTLLIGDQILRLATAVSGRAAFLDRFQWSVIRRHYREAVYPNAVAA